MGVGDVNMKCAGDVAKGYVLAWDVAAGYALAWVRIRVPDFGGMVSS